MADVVTILSCVPSGVGACTTKRRESVHEFTLNLHVGRSKENTIQMRIDGGVFAPTMDLTPAAARHVAALLIEHADALAPKEA